MSIQESLFTEIAKAIRQKGGTSDVIVAKDFAKAILALPTSSSPTDPDNPDCTIQVISRGLGILPHNLLSATSLTDSTKFILQARPILSTSGLISIDITDMQVNDFIHKEASEL